MVDLPDDTDSPDAHKLSTQEAAANTGYFPMPSMLDTGTSAPSTAQQKHNGLQNPAASAGSGTKSDNTRGRGSGIVSDYVAAPSELSSSTLSSSSTVSGSSSKSTLASTSAAVAKKSRQLFAKVLPKISTSSPSKGSKTKGDSSSQQQSKQQPQPTPPTSITAPPPSADPSTGELEEKDDSDLGDLVDLLDLGDPTDSMDTSYSNGITNGNQSLNPPLPSSSDLGHSSGYYQDTSIGGFADLSTAGSTMMTVPSTLTSDPFVAGGATAALTPSAAGTAASAPISATNSGYFQSPEGIGLTSQQGGAAPPPPPPTFDPFPEDDDPDSFFLPDLPGDSEMSNNSSGGVMYSGSIVTLSSGQFPPPKK